VSSGRQKDTIGSYTPILTSKGRSLLGIALGNKNIDIVRYLVVDKKMMLWAERDLSVDTLVQNLDLVLRVLPEDALAGQESYHQVQECSSKPVSNSNDNVTASNWSNATDMASSTILGSLDNDMIAAIRASIEPDDEPGGNQHHDEVCTIQ
jgi:hypothetical protein